MLKEIPEVIKIGDVEYVREDKTKPHRDITHPQYIMNIRKDDINDSINIKIDDTIIMSIDNQEVILYNEPGILKKWADNGYLCENWADKGYFYCYKEYKWNNIILYLYKGMLYCNYVVNNEHKKGIVYDFKTMKKGNITQGLPTWEHCDSFKVLC